MKFTAIETVECEICSRELELRHGPINIFGNEVWYENDDDPETQVIIDGEKAYCFDCNVKR